MFSPQQNETIRVRSRASAMPAAKPATASVPIQAPVATSTASAPPARPSFLTRLRNAWRALRGKPPIGPVPSGGAVVVHAFAFGRRGQYRLIGRMGYHAAAVSVGNERSTAMTLLSASHIDAADYPAFAEFMARPASSTPGNPFTPPDAAS
jgi:hypothetical protein